MSASIVNEQNYLDINQAKVKRRLARIIKELGLAETHVSILFTDDNGIRVLNRDFRKIDKPTNVLAFPDTNKALGQPKYLGDLVLSAQTIVKEAEEQLVDPGEMMYFYLIHGLLHLIGYDHELGPLEEQAQQAETERLMLLIKHDLH